MGKNGNKYKMWRNHAETEITFINNFLKTIVRLAPTPKVSFK